MNTLQIRAYRESDQHAVVVLWRECGLVRPWNHPVKDILPLTRLFRGRFPEYGLTRIAPNQSRRQSAATSGSIESRSAAARARSRSYNFSRFSQYSGGMARAWPMRKAVSAVIDRRPWTISLMRRGATPIALAKRY